MKSVAEEIASELLRVQAVKLNPSQPFRWSSGWLSPIYCDNRLTLSFPALRSQICDALVDVVCKQFPDVEVIAGVATAGIPQGALIADRLGLPFVYVRSSAKEHGMKNMIEGKVEAGQKVVVIEDLVSTGGSSLKAAQALRTEAQADVLGMVAVFTYQLQAAKDNFTAAQLPLYCLSDYEALIKVASEESYIATDSLQTLKAWRENPAEWGN